MKKPMTKTNSKEKALYQNFKKNIDRDKHIMKKLVHIQKTSKSPLVELAQLLIITKVPPEVANSEIFDKITMSPSSEQWVYRNDNELISPSDVSKVFDKAYHYFTLDIVTCLKSANDIL